MHTVDMPINLLVIAIVCLEAFLPSISRPGLLFAITVPPGFAASDTAQAIIRAYRVRLLASAVIVLLFINTMSGVPNYADIIDIIGLLLFMLLSIANFLWARHHILPHAASSTRVQISLAAAPVLDILPRPYWVMAIPYLILIASAGWLAQHWSAIPERFPVHIDDRGIANGWSNHTFMGVFGILILGLTQCGLLNAMMLIGRHIRRLPQTATRVRATNWIVVEAMMIIALLIAIVAQLPLYGATMINSGMFLYGILFFVVLGILMPAVTFSVLLRRTPAETISIGGDRTPDRCWKWGLVYFNPDDPAVFVEKRSGIGYTLNMARPLAIILMIVIVGLIIILPILT